VHDWDGTANRGESFVPKFVSGIEVMGELVKSPAPQRIEKKEAQ
jgi:hypothetical protein